MTDAHCDTAYLYTTAVPVLLGGTKTAGKTAAEIYLRHEITPHWFGKGFDLNLLMYAKRHLLPAPLREISDDLLLQILLDFAAEQVGLLVLYPCDPESETLIRHNAAALESHYVLLDLPFEGDPLAPLVRKFY
ncbi:MAG: hypothetical protein IJW00_09480 [Clostridia bacterium]|nr:hypothetical protein [Clostridia bacterium]